eukprot:scpid44738/ scgid28478/ Choline/ethanolaminephosphotransferase 1
MEAAAHRGHRIDPNRCFSDDILNLTFGCEVAFNAQTHHSQSTRVHSLLDVPGGQIASSSRPRASARQKAAAMDIINSAQLKVLSKHKYSVGGQSWLERVFLSPFCNILVEMFPRWLAPNVITFIGALCFVVPGCYLVFHTPTATLSDDKMPGAFWLTLSVCCLAYQLLDCIDGKQARRTGNSSPLGEFLDHGIDAFATIILPLSAASCALLGEVPLMHAMAPVAAISLFFMAHWHSYVAGTMHVNSMVDVEEARTYFTMLFILNGLHPMGRGFFLQEIAVVPWLPMPLTVRDLFFAIPAVFIVISFATCVLRCEGVIAQRPASERLELHAPLIQLVLWIIPTLLTCVTSQLFRSHPQLIISTLGLVMVHLVHRLLVMNMCKSKVQPFHPILAIPYVLFLNSVMLVTPEHSLFVFFLVAQLVYILIWSALVIRQLLTYLNISLCTISSW